MRKLTALMLSLMLLCAASCALAGASVTVTGSGSTLVAADTAVVNLGISAQDRDVLKAQQKANEAIASIRAVLTGNGIPAEDINTGYLNIYAMYDYTGGTEVISAYNASSTLAIRVTDMSAVGTVIDLSFGAGANMLNGIVFSASETEEARAESLKKAVADARAKAEVLAEASGLKIKGVAAISEGGTFSYDSGVNQFSRALGKETEEAQFDTVVQAAKLQVTADITVVFETE